MTTDKLPNVAVLLAAYNGMQWIEEQVKSILQQKGVDVTLFISVDLSTDGTDKWVHELTNNSSNVIMLPYGDRFGGAGPNFFRLIRDVEVSAFDAVAFADQDDIWFEDKLQRAFDFIKSGYCDVYSSNVTAFWPDGKTSLIIKSQPKKQFDHFFEAAGPGCTYVFNSDSIEKFKSFLIDSGEQVDLISMHDWLAYAFCRDRGFLWFIDEKPSMLYRQHGNNQVGTNTGFRAFSKRLALVRQSWYRDQVEMIAGLVNPELLVFFNSYLYRLRNFYLMRRRLRDALVLFCIFFLGIY